MADSVQTAIKLLLGRGQRIARLVDERARLVAAAGSSGVANPTRYMRTRAIEEQLRDLDEQLGRLRYGV